jgi:hypothetical protein
LFPLLHRRFQASSHLADWPLPSRTRPALPPVNASMVASRLATHDSGPGWLAMPFLYDSFMHNSTPVLSRRTPLPARLDGAIQRCHSNRSRDFGYSRHRQLGNATLVARVQVLNLEIISVQSRLHIIWWRGVAWRGVAVFGLFRGTHEDPQK